MEKGNILCDETEVYLQYLHPNPHWNHFEIYEQFYDYTNILSPSHKQMFVRINSQQISVQMGHHQVTLEEHGDGIHTKYNTSIQFY
jgi:hypothetical protein